MQATMSGVEEDKYRSYLHGEGELNTTWRWGGPPNYDDVNKLFEEERTKVWPPGSLEEQVQNLIKTWEMEVFHKASLHDFKSLDVNKYTLSLNGRKDLNMMDIKKLGGGYNPQLQTSLPEEHRIYDPEKETAESSHRAFLTAFPRGFALEVVKVYAGPPEIVCKFRHWGYSEGPFKGHAPTGELVEFYGIAIIQVDENMRIGGVEFFYERGELLGGLVKGAAIDDTSAQEAASSCPILRNTG
ncbi:Pathogen-related protein [Hibiscus syriacus]|uniref:Pathogen-related protein n=1 Tax=Hibiscus syriacus TaxID=106335 RepID=A0A6A3D356_HIBSY|nr:pathogen-related protein-like [Hibiscus syriacus]KAE8735034.1 Pathogen-related protein [Hibiscus syriacus]